MQLVAAVHWLDHGYQLVAAGCDEDLPGPELCIFQPFAGDRNLQQSVPDL